MRKIIFLVCAGMLIIGGGFSQEVKPVKWGYKINMLSNCEAEIEILAQVDKGWHLYSQKHINGLPLVFEFDASDLFTLTGPIIEPEPFKEYDDVFGYDVFYFKESNVVFKQKIKITSAKSFSIQGKITGQVCQYESGICMPLNEKFISEVPSCP